MIFLALTLSTDIALQIPKMAKVGQERNMYIWNKEESSYQLWQMDYCRNDISFLSKYPKLSKMSKFEVFNVWNCLGVILNAFLFLFLKTPSFESETWSLCHQISDRTLLNTAIGSAEALNLTLIDLNRYGSRLNWA